MKKEQILILIKPDGVQLGHTGEIIHRIERKGYQIDELKLTWASKEQLKTHYCDLIDKPFYKEIENYMLEGPIVAIVASGVHIIDTFHKMAGNTNPSLAECGTIRGDFGHESEDGVIRNIIHSSDSLVHAKNEIKIWFPEKTIKERP